MSENHTRNSDSAPSSSGNLRVFLHNLAGMGIIAISIASGILALTSFISFSGGKTPVITRQPPADTGRAPVQEGQSLRETEPGDPFSPEKTEEAGLTAAELDNSCSQGAAGSCFKLGFWHYSRNIANASYKEADRYFAKACSLSNARACYLQGLNMENNLPPDYAPAENRITALKKSCDLGFLQGCDAAVRNLYHNGDYATAEVYASRQCPVTERSSESCLYLALLAPELGERVPERLKPLLETGCRKSRIPAACYAYAQDLPPEKIREKSAILKDLCLKTNDNKYCQASKLSITNREKQESKEAPDMDEACRRGDNAACLRLASFLENHSGHTASDRNKAADIYRDLCQKRDPDGCREHRRIQGNFGK